MKASEGELRRMFVQATDEVVPPAPWLEGRVVEALNRRGNKRTYPLGLGAFGGFGPSLRLTAGVVAIVLAVAAVASILMSARNLQRPSVPGSRPTVQTPAPNQLPFTPSPAVRAPSWPPGGPVPAQLAGAWKPAAYNNVLYLGGYTFESGTDYAVTDYGTLCGPGPCEIGNVVVNGSEIDFIQDPCGRIGYGYERFSYVLNGDVLVLTRLDGAGQSNCGLLMAGTYTRVRTAGA